MRRTCQYYWLCKSPGQHPPLYAASSRPQDGYSQLRSLTMSEDHRNQMKSIRNDSMARKKAGGRRREVNAQESAMMSEDGDADGDGSWSNFCHARSLMFSPQEVCSRAGAWPAIRLTRDGVLTHTHRKFYTQKLLRTVTFTRKSL